MSRCRSIPYDPPTMVMRSTPRLLIASCVSPPFVPDRAASSLPTAAAVAKRLAPWSEDDFVVHSVAVIRSV